WPLLLSLTLLWLYRLHVLSSVASPAAPNTAAIAATTCERHPIAAPNAVSPRPHRPPHHHPLEWINKGSGVLNGTTVFSATTFPHFVSPSLRLSPRSVAAKPLPDDPVFPTQTYASRAQAGCGLW